MTLIIEKAKWRDYFQSLSREFIDWQTTVQIFDPNDGAQTLSEGLPFGGLTFEPRGDNDTIMLSMGIGPDTHQNHNITGVTKVAFEPSGIGPAGTVDIENSAGTKTLITFVQPMPVLMEYVAAEIVAVG